MIKVASFDSVAMARSPDGFWVFGNTGVWSDFIELVSTKRAATNLWVGDMLINCGHDSLRISLSDTEDFEVIAQGNRRIDIFATSKAVATKVMLFGKQIKQAVQSRTLTLNRGDYLHVFRERRDRIMQETKKFVEWKSKQSKNDKLLGILIAKYQIEFDQLMATLQGELIDAVCNISKELGVRYISIHPDFIIGFENVRISTTNGMVPIAVIIAELLEVGMMQFSSGMRVFMRTYLDRGGVYDLTGDTPVKIGPPVTENSANHSAIERRRYPHNYDIWEVYELPL